VRRRHVPTAAALAALALALASAAPARAQQIPVGTGGSVSSLVGVPVDVPLVVDLSARTEKLGSVTIRFAWNPSVLRFDGGSSSTFGALAVNEDTAAQGVLRFAGANPAGVGGRVVVGVGRFMPLTTDVTLFTLTVSELSAAGSFASLLPDVVIEASSYCNGAGTWGDVVENLAINAQDALAVLTSAVGLPVIGVNLPMGDVDASGSISTRDALIILSYAVGLDISAFRIGRVEPGGCAVAPSALAIVPGAVGTLEAGQSVGLQVRGQQPGGTVLPVTGVRWSSSDAAVATVDSLGFVQTLAAGTATIRAVRDGRDTLQLALTVVTRRTRHVVSAASPGGVGTPELPFATIADAVARLEAGDTIDLKPGRYEGDTLPVPTVVLGEIVGNAGPVLVPYSANEVLRLGSGRYLLRRVALEGAASTMLNLGTADTVELDSVRINMDVSRCASAAIGGSDIRLLALTSVRLIGDGYLNGCADAIWLYGNTAKLVLDNVGITDFGGSGVYAYNVDSAIIRRSGIHGNAGYAVWTSAWSGYGSGRVTAATSTALVLDSVRMSGEYSYGLVNAYDVRHARVVNSHFVGGGYGQSLYFEGNYEATSNRGWVELRNDSLVVPDADWIYAYALDSVTVDSVRGTVGDSYLSDAGLVRVRNSTFRLTDYYGAALYTYGAGTRVVVDSVEIRGQGCQCATGIYTYASGTTTVRRLRASDLDEGVYHYGDSALTVTESVFERMDYGVYGYGYYASAAIKALIRHVTMSDAGYGVELSGYSAVVDSSTFTRGWSAVSLYGQHRDTVRHLTVTDYDEGIQVGAAGLVDSNQIVRPYDNAIYSYRGSDTTRWDTLVIRANTVTCTNQYADPFYVYYGRTVVVNNTVVNSCYSGIYAYGASADSSMHIRGNVLPIGLNTSNAVIRAYGQTRYEIVGNLIEGTAQTTAYGAIDLGDYYTRMPWARVDSNTIRFPKRWGIFTESVDTLQVRGNLIEDYQSICCSSYSAAISAYAAYYYAADTSVTRIVGNTVRRSKGIGIRAELYGGIDSLWVDSNAVSNADTAAIYVNGGPLLARGNNIRSNARVGIDLPSNTGLPQPHLVQGNAFQGNSQFALRAQYDSVDARGNWWGVSGATPGTGGADAVSGRIDTTAVLSSEPTVPSLGAPVPRIAASAGVAALGTGSGTRYSAPARTAAPARTELRSRTLRRAGDRQLVLNPPPLLAGRAAERARAQAAEDSVRAVRQAAREARLAARNAPPRTTP
jgi:hypothetical protein